MRYGARFRELRKERWSKTVLQLAQELGMSYAGSVYTIEQAWRVPTLPTLEKHARALRCEPWDLLLNVDTEYDLVRIMGQKPIDAARREWRALMIKYEETTRRGKLPKSKKKRA